MTSVTIPNSVTSIGGSAFLGCRNLISITIPDGVTSIGQGAFSDCSNLTSVTIPDSVTSIGDYVFHGCSSLTSVTIPNSVTSIGERVFYSCSSLTFVNIPEEVEHIAGKAFYGTQWLAEKFKENPFWIFKDSLIATDENLNGKVDIPDSVTSIGGYAFSGCSNLTSVTIPDSVTSIRNYAFDDCTRLTSVTIPNSVTSIGERAFYGCSSLTSISIPDSVTSIGDRAFESCPNLKSLTLPNIAGCNHITFHYHKDEPYSKQIEMLLNKKYSVNMKSEVKYDLLCQLFRLKPDEEELTAYIKKNFSRIMHFAIDHNDVETINRVCESEKLITDKNIDNLLDYSINNTQNGGNLEIQATLMNYKNEHFGDKKKRLRL